MRKQYAQPQVKRFSRTLLALVFALVLPVVVLVLSLRWVNPPATAFMLQQSDANQRAYSWVSLQEISDSAILAVVAAEDQMGRLRREGAVLAAVRN